MLPTRYLDPAIPEVIQVRQKLLQHQLQKMPLAIPIQIIQTPPAIPVNISAIAALFTLVGSTSIIPT